MIRALLTIDDIASANTPAIVDYLNGRGIPAILFATGKRVEQYYREACYALTHGMIIGNHSYSHPHFSEITLEAGVAEIEHCEEVLNRLYADCGIERKYRPFRFPFGDKGGENRDALQTYFRDHGFNKVDDTHIPYAFWREEGRDTSIDTFWTYNFEEYRLKQEGLPEEHIWNKMRDMHPTMGAPLFAENARHILLLHAHDDTDALMPNYYQRMLDHLLENGVVFDAPRFLKTK